MNGPRSEDEEPASAALQRESRPVQTQAIQPYSETLKRDVSIGS